MKRNGALPSRRYEQAGWIVSFMISGILWLTPPLFAQRPVNDIPPGGEKISVNFEDVDLKEVVRSFSKWTGKNFILDDKISGKITVIAPTKVTKREAFDIFLSILEVRNFTTVQIGSIIKIIKVDQAKESNIPTMTSGEPRYLSESDAYITQLIRLKYIQANDVANALKPLLSKKGSIIPYTPANILILTDTAANLNRFLRIISELDQESTEDRLEVIPIKYAEAATLAEELSQIFAPSDQGRTTRRTTRRTRRRGRTTQFDQEEESVKKILADERTNYLIVLANAVALAKIKDLIEKLDIDVIGERGKIHVYYLENADAEELAGTLGQLLGGGGQSSTTRGRQDRNTRTRRGASGREERRRGGRTRSEGLRGSRLRDRQPSAVPGARGELGSITDLEGEIVITADPNTNALIIVAGRQEYETLRQVIQKLDIARPQVFVEAAILEIRYDDNFDWQFEFRQVKDVLEQSTEGKSFFGGSNSGMIEGVQNTLATGQGGLPTGFIFGAADGTINVGGVDLPNIGVFLRLIESTTDVNILATPQLLTTNNEEAEIVIGQNIPFPTGQVFSLGTNTPSITVEREDVGITLRLTPQINESDYIRLELFHEITSVVGSPQGLDPNALGVTTSVRSAETTVIVRNMQTIVIGGLISDEVSEVESKLPILGDIPIFGFLFKNHSRVKRKVNLMILLTPYIIRRGEDLRQITNRKKAQMEAAQHLLDLGLSREEMEKILEQEKEPIEERPRDTEETIEGTLNIVPRAQEGNDSGERRDRGEEKRSGTTPSPLPEEPLYTPPAESDSPPPAEVSPPPLGDEAPPPAAP